MLLIKRYESVKAALIFSETEVQVTILYKTVGTFCNKTSVPQNQCCQGAPGMNKGHVYTNTAWWGRERGGGCMTRTWILNHTCHLHTYNFITNFLMVNRAFAPTSFAQDYSIIHP